MGREEYVAGEEYVVGADVIGALAQMMPQLRQQISRAPAGSWTRPPARGPVQIPFSKPPLSVEPAQANTSNLRSYLGFGFVSWAIGDGADKVIVVEPQESFRGERFIADVDRTGVTNSLVPLLRRIDIGTQPQSPSVELSAPLAMFRADATESDLDLQVAYRGTKIQITLGLSAAPVGAAVVATVGMFGRWIR